MNRNLIIALIVAAVAAAAGLVMCQKPAGDSSSTLSIEPVNQDRTPAAPDMAVGDACNTSCPDGSKLEILCAEGETPQCDCNATPRTQCLPPAKP